MKAWLLSSAVLILVTAALRALTKGRIWARLQYAMWLPVLLRLLIPFSLFEIPLPSGSSAGEASSPVARQEYAVFERSNRENAAASYSVGDPASFPVRADTPSRQDAEKTYAASTADTAPSGGDGPIRTSAWALSPVRLLRRIWLAGALAVFAATAASEVRFCRRLRRSRQPVRGVSGRLPVYSCDWLGIPCLAGFLRPAIYLPPDLPHEEDLLRHVLAHEEAHFRHGDPLWARLRCVCLALHWFNPLVWLTVWLSKQDAELACDEGALAQLGEGERLAYGRTLLRLSLGDGARTPAPIPAMLGQKEILKKRILRLALPPRMTAAVLVLSLLLSLIAAGCSFTETKEEPERAYYEASYRALDLPEETMPGLCHAGDRVFAVYTPDQTPAAENGDSPQTWTQSVLLSCAADGTGGCETLPWDVPEALREALPPDAVREYLSLTELVTGPEGSLIALGFASYWTGGTKSIPLSDGSYLSPRSWETQSFVVCLDFSGRERFSYLLPEGSQVGQPAADADGNVYLVSEQSVTVFAPDGELLLKLDSPSLLRQLVRLSDGRVAAVSYEGSGVAVRTIELSSGQFSKPISVGAVFSSVIYPGAFGWDLLVNDGTTLSGVNADGAKQTLVTWINCDLDGNELTDLSVAPDGESVLCLFSPMRMPGRRTGECGVAVLRETAEPPREEKTVLTLACMGLDPDAAALVLRFNRSDPDYRVEVQDYSVYNTSDTLNAALTALNAQIVSGSAPDLFCTRELPIRAYADSALLEDLWPYIDADTELGGRDALVTPLFEALSQKGRLYQIAPSFSLYTVIGSKSVVGERSGWTMDEFRQIWQTMPEGCDVMGGWIGRDGALGMSLTMRLDQFFDRERGLCRFDSEEFRELVRFTELFDKERGAYASETEEFDRIRSGEQMLLYVYLDSFEKVLYYSGALGDEAVYVGLPSAGGNGSAFDVSNGLAMSASCAHKDGAWRFMRMMLDRDTQIAAGDGFLSPFPSNRLAFEAMLEKEMTPEYQRDADGSYVLDAAGNKIQQARGAMGTEGKTVPLYAMTQTQSDRLVDLVQNTVTLRYWDDAIMDIVLEEMDAYYGGRRSLDEATAYIQRRAELYMSENN